MTTLHLIRHGKASPGKASYDELHPVGQEQARLLGIHLRERGQHFDAVYCGPLQRQLETQRIMREAAGDISRAWPSMIVADALAEAPIEALVRQCMPIRMQSDEKLQRFVNELADGIEKPKAQAVFGELFAYLVELWARGELGAPGIETATEFGRRIQGVLEEIVAAERSAREVAVITSNGVVGWVIAYVLGEQEPCMRGPSRRLLNTSITKLFVAPEGLSVMSQNVVEHLRDSELHTFI